MADGWLETEARAKVNLQLRIFPRGPDGFHPVETILCRITLADRVRVRLRAEPGVSIRVSGSESAPEGPGNLAARAAGLFLGRAGIHEGVEVELEKRVPPGSGLGGGSSDAAAVLRLLERAVGPTSERHDLLRLAAELGTDVSFFAADAPLAFAWGRGDRLLTGPPLPPRPMALLLPAESLSTAEAYAAWDDRSAREASGGPAAESLVMPYESLSSWEDIRRRAGNDFEPVIFGRHPALQSFRAALDETRPLLASLSGSGSALFAVYETEGERDGAVERLSERLSGVRVLSVSGPE